MPNIKPISDLKNYTEVLKEVNIGAPVYLTRNGRGEYAIVDIKEFNELRATLSLLAELERGEQSALEHGWLSFEEVEAELLL